MTVPGSVHMGSQRSRWLPEVGRNQEVLKKELKITREQLEWVRSPKEHATLGEQKSFQHVSGVPGRACNPFVIEEARNVYFDLEEALILNFWIDRVRESGMIKYEQLQLGVILEELVVEPSVPKLEGQLSFECVSWDGPPKTSLVTIWELMKPSWSTSPNAGLIRDVTADIELEDSDDESLHGLTVIDHLLTLKVKNSTHRTFGGKPA